MVTMIPIPTTLLATYDLIEFRHSNAVTDEHDSSEDTNGDREAHKTTNLLTDKKYYNQQLNKRKAKIQIYIMFIRFII